MRDPAKPYPHDKILAATILRLIPHWVHPNHVTVLRFLLTPFVFALIGSANYRWGVPLFLFTAATDAIDGSLARIRGQVTKWGTIYDPLADKILIGGIVFLVVFEHINFWLGFSIIILETIFILAAFFRMKKGLVRPANLWGKIKMSLEVFGVTTLLLALAGDIQFFMNVSFATFALAIVFALLSLASHGS